MKKKLNHTWRRRKSFDVLVVGDGEAGAEEAGAGHDGEHGLDGDEQLGVQDTLENGVQPRELGAHDEQGDLGVKIT